MRESTGELTPTTKNTPANTAAGMVCSTASSGPVMVPINNNPIRKCVTLCSTTAFARTTGVLISPGPVPSEALPVGVTRSSVS